MAEPSLPSVGRTRPPVSLDPFVGRDAEVGKVRALGRSERLLTLTGPGGCGKTRLAVEASLVESSPCFVDLSALTEPDSVADAVRTALGIPEHPDRDPIAAVVATISDADVLIVLDNCEHVVQGAAAVVAGLLRACPGMRVLATSREPLGVPGEWVWHVPPLSVPPEAVRDPAAVVSYDAVRLLLDRVHRAHNEFGVSADNAPAIAALVRGLDGIPLAIELAAAQVARLGLQHVVDGLDHQLALLRSGARTTGPRQHALEASIRWSYALLDEREQLLFDWLSVFRGGFRLDAALAVLAGRLPASDVPAALGQLVDKSVVQRDAFDRFSLLESLRQFGHERLVAQSELASARDQHLAWIAQTARQAESALTGSAQAEWLDRLEAELDNIRAALEWAGATDRAGIALEIASDLTFFWKLHSHLIDGRRWLEVALDGHTGVSTESFVRASWSRADLAYWAADFTTAAAEGERALAAARRIGDRHTEARALWTLANVVNLTVSPGACRPRVREAVALARETGDRWLLGVALELLAITTLHCGLTAEVQPLLDEAREVARETGSPQLETWNLAIEEMVALYRCDHARVDELYERGSHVGQAIVDSGSTGFLRLTYVESLLQRGRHAEASVLLASAVAEFEGNGHLNLEPAFRFFVYISRLGEDPGGRRDALAELDRARTTSLFWTGLATLAHAIEDVRSGHPDVAEAMAEAVVAANELAVPWHTAITLVLAGIAQLLDDLDDAERLFHEALAMAIECAFPMRMIEAVLALGYSLARREDDVGAARVFGAADAACRERGIDGPIFESTLGPLLRPAVRERLGDEAYEHAYAQGESLTLDDAVAHVRRLRGSRARPPEGWASLTAAEARVVELAAEGLTNPEIAERLFVSRGTVKTHLSHAFTKLRVANRAELAALAARREIRQMAKPD